MGRADPSALHLPEVRQANGGGGMSQQETVSEARHAVDDSPVLRIGQGDYERSWGPDPQNPARLREIGTCHLKVLKESPEYRRWEMLQLEICALLDRVSALHPQVIEIGERFCELSRAFQRMTVDLFEREALLSAREKTARAKRIREES
jgi:hypothetical protein